MAIRTIYWKKEIREMRKLTNKVIKILEEGKITDIHYYDYHFVSPILRFSLEFENNEYLYSYNVNMNKLDSLYDCNSTFIDSRIDYGNKIREIFLKRGDVRSIIIKYLLKGGEER